MAGSRYSEEPKRKLNMKKVFLVIILPILIIIFAMLLKNVLEEAKNLKITGNLQYNLLLKNEKWGVVDSSGAIVIEPSFEEMIQIPNKTMEIFICTYDVDYKAKSFKTKVLDAKGNEILTNLTLVQAVENYDDDSFWYENDVLIYKKDTRYGLVDFKGKELLSPEYDNIVSLKGVKNSFIISKDGKVRIV